MLSTLEQSVLRTYREFLITPGQMLCFSGQDLERIEGAIETLIDKKMLTRESFKGGYSLTRAGFAAMQECQE